ncbi:MAG: hypothetical protein AAF989_05710, partial [Planctomycetota bacterium]
MPDDSAANMYQRPEIDVWADVGGTFTDCFVTDRRIQASGRRRRTKVLSTGLVRGRATRVASDVWSVQLPAHGAVSDFWAGCEVNLLTPSGTPKRIGRCVASEVQQTDGKVQRVRLQID